MSKNVLQYEYTVQIKDTYFYPQLLMELAAPQANPVNVYLHDLRVDTNGNAVDQLAVLLGCYLVEFSGNIVYQINNNPHHINSVVKFRSYQSFAIDISLDEGPFWEAYHTKLNQLKAQADALANFKYKRSLPHINLFLEKTVSKTQLQNFWPPLTRSLVVVNNDHEKTCKLDPPKPKERLFGCSDFPPTTPQNIFLD